MEKHPDCKEYEKLIPDFVDGKLEYFTLKRFCAHIKSCPDCKEELTIKFLISEGLQRLEEGDAFDLNRELDRRMAEAEKKIRKNDEFLKAGVVAEICSMAAILCWIFWILFR